MTPEEIIDNALFVVRKFRMETWESVRALCESPIEELFLAAAFAAGVDSHSAAHIYASPFSDDFEFFPGDHIWPQTRMGNYRLDFLIVHVAADGTRTFVAVECDGHEFHERTKEQAARDKMRDRFLTGRGIKVLRFAGSEIYRSPILCWTETLNVLWESPEVKIA
jgi:very-short-patch-repair endonuclease